MSQSAFSMPTSAWPRTPDGDGAESALIDQARREPAAFGELYRMHHAAIAGYVFRRVGDEHVTEDLVADVFVTALQYLPRFRARGVPLRAWLYRIASNRVNRWVRREWRRMPEPLGGAHQAPTNGEDPEAALARERARRALLEVSPKFQAVLALHYLEGLPVEQVATTLGLRTGTVKSRLSRGRVQMRKRLEPRRM